MYPFLGLTPHLNDWNYDIIDIYAVVFSKRNTYFKYFAEPLWIRNINLNHKFLLNTLLQYMFFKIYNHHSNWIIRISSERLWNLSLHHKPGNQLHHKCKTHNPETITGITRAHTVDQTDFDFKNVCWTIYCWHFQALTSLINMLSVELFNVARWYWCCYYVLIYLSSRLTNQWQVHKC